MFLYLLFGAFSTVLVWLYVRWLKITRYWADRGVPYVPPVPILGNLTFPMRENFGVWMRRMNEHFKSPYIGIWLLCRPALVINSPEIVRNILVRDFNNFRNRYVSSGSTDPLGGLNLFTVNEMFVDYVTDILGTSTLGIKSDAVLTGTGPLREITKDFSTYDLDRAMSLFSIFFYPDLVDIFRLKLLPKYSSNYFKKMFQVIASQRNADQKERDATDFLEVLLKVQKENESYSDDLIIAQAAIFLLAGYEATGGSLTYMIYELAHRPDLQDKLYQELSQSAERNGGDFDIDVLSELTYLNCIIKEGNRKYMTLTWLDRVCEEDYRIDDNLTIEAGTPVFINLYGIQYSSKYFPEPYKFDPDRFLPENRNKIEPYTYLTFGEGPRACIGKRFGLIAQQFALASIFLKYRTQPYPNTPKPSDIKINHKGVLLVPAETLHVEFISRK